MKGKSMIENCQQKVCSYEHTIDWIRQPVKLRKMKDKFNYVDIDIVAGDGKLRNHPPTG